MLVFFSLFIKLNLLPLLLFNLKSCLILCNHMDWLKNNRLPCPLLSPRVCSNLCTLSRWCYLTISSPSPLALNLSQHQGLFQWVGSLHQVARVLELQLQHQSFQRIFRVHFLQDWLIWSPLCPRDSQESSPTPQFKSINSSVLSLLCGPTLTSTHDYWKSNSFDYMDLCQQSNISAFNMLSRFAIVFLPKSKDLLISWLQSPSAVIWETKKIKSVTLPRFPLLLAMKWA